MVFGDGLEGTKRRGSTALVGVPVAVTRAASLAHVSEIARRRGSKRGRKGIYSGGVYLDAGSLLVHREHGLSPYVLGRRTAQTTTLTMQKSYRLRKRAEISAMHEKTEIVRSRRARFRWASRRYAAGSWSGASFGGDSSESGGKNCGTSGVEAKKIIHSATAQIKTRGCPRESLSRLPGSEWAAHWAVLDMTPV